MNVILTAALAAIFGLTTLFTHDLTITGRLKPSSKLGVSNNQKILVYQGDELLSNSRAKSKGVFTINFYTSSGSNKARLPVDFYTVTPKNDMVLMASVETFSSDGELAGNFFMPEKVAGKLKYCPSCRKTDRIYTMVYSLKEQKEFSFHKAKFYCSRDKRKF